MSATIEAALFYHRRGWVPVRVGYRDKHPDPGDGWPKLRPTPSDIAKWGRCNVGVLLGSASGGLTDIDLDCAEAIELAPYYLPGSWVFGRTSKPRSHYLYICHGTRTHKLLGMDDKTMLEIRSDAADGPGLQTVMPPSVHVSGEAIEWDPDCADGTDGPREISDEDLRSCVVKLARGVLFMQLGATVDEARTKVAAYKPAPRPAPRRNRGHQSTPSAVVDRARKYLAKMDPSISGSGGDGALFKAAVALVRGFELGESTALHLLETEFNPRCQPAWRRKDLEHKVRQAANRSRLPDGYLLGEGRGA